MFLVSGIVFWLLLICWVWDLMFLHFGKNRVEIERHYPEKLSNGDDNHFELAFISHYPKKIKARVLEEFPMQLQIREKEFEIELAPLIPKHVEYELRPTKEVYMNSEDAMCWSGISGSSNGSFFWKNP